MIEVLKRYEIITTDGQSHLAPITTIILDYEEITWLKHFLADPLAHTENPIKDCLLNKLIAKGEYNYELSKLLRKASRI